MKLGTFAGGALLAALAAHACGGEATGTTAACVESSCGKPSSEAGSDHDSGAGPATHNGAGIALEAGAPSCDTRLQQIGDRLDDALGALDKSCKTDDDCTLVGPDDRCWPGCDTWDVSKTAAAALAEVRASVDTELCDQYLVDGCYPAAIFFCPSIVGEPAKCIQGACGTAPSPTNSDAGVPCVALTANIRARLERAADGADRACASDADCRVVELGNACATTCTYAGVSASGARVVESNLSSMAADSCPAFLRGGCVPETLPCPPGGSPRCNAGVCSVQ